MIINQYFFINMNEYFSANIKNWCNTKFKKLKYDFNNVDVETTFCDNFCQHRTIYMNLRQILFEYIFNENTSQLNLCAVSTKKKAWQSTESFIKNGDVRNNETKNGETKNDDVIKQIMNILKKKINSKNVMLNNFLKFD